MVGCVLDDILVTLQVNVSLGVVMGMTMKIYETLSKKVTGVFVVEMMSVIFYTHSCTCKLPCLL